MTVADPFEGLLSGDMDEWLAALPAYQRQSIAALLRDHDAVDVAMIWLENSGPKDTAPFGGIRTAANNFYDNILKELQKAICGGEEYATERKELADATKSGGKLLLVGALSTAIAPHVGAAAAVIGPAVAITLGIVANAGTATACQALQDLIERRASAPAEGNATEAE